MADEIMTKKMPFAEEEGYVASVIDTSIRQAHAAGMADRRHPFLYSMAGVAALALLLISVFLNREETVQEPQPAYAKVMKLDSFDKYLNSLSEEEVNMIQYYEIEEINY